jgi:hypothetical protein
MTNNYNIFTYKHKQIIIKDLMNFNDPDFKKQVILNYKNEVFSSYDMKLFLLHIRNINLCLNKLAKKYRESSNQSIHNSIVFLYENYLEAFVDSIIAHYFHTTSKDENKQNILNEIMSSVYDEM